MSLNAGRVYSMWSVERGEKACLLEDFPQRAIDDERLGKVCRFDSISTPEALVLLTASRWIERDGHPAEFIHHGVEPFLHLLFHIREGGDVNEVVLLHWVVPKIKQLVGVPNPIVGGVFVAVAA